MLRPWRQFVPRCVPSCSSKRTTSSSTPAAQHGFVERDRGEVEVVLVVAARVDPDRARLPQRVAVLAPRAARGRGRASAPTPRARARPCRSGTAGRRSRPRSRSTRTPRPTCSRASGRRRSRTPAGPSGSPPRSARTSRRSGCAAPARSSANSAATLTSNSAVAGVRREPAEEVGPQHPPGHRAEPARRLARDAAMLARGRGAEARVDERHDLVAEVRPVAPGRGRVDPLRAADAT